MTIKKNLTTQHEGSEVASIELTVPESILDIIKKAKDLIKDSSFVNNVEIDVWTYDFKEKQFGSTIDDDEAEELGCDEFGYFNSDVQYLKVYGSGRVAYRMYNKWDGSQFIEVPIVD